MPRPHKGHPGGVRGAGQAGAELGSGWQCFSLTDISGEKRREALERTFFMTS
jgi:hypothetical protein